MSITKITHVTVLVNDQDEALNWYTEVLGLEKRQDDAKTIPGFRWITVAPKGQTAPEIVLLRAEDRDRDRVGHGTLWVLETEDCEEAHQCLEKRGVKFITEPKKAPWGVSAMFEDLYGNRFNLAQHNE